MAVGDGVGVWGWSSAHNSPLRWGQGLVGCVLVTVERHHPIQFDPVHVRQFLKHSTRSDPQAY